MQTKSLISFIISLVLLAGIGAVTPNVAAAVENSPVTIMLDGSRVEMGAPARIVKATTYVPMYCFSRALGAETITYTYYSMIVSAPGLRIYASAGDLYIVANGRYLFVPTLCRVIDGKLFVPIRPLAKAFGAEVTWCEDRANTVLVLPTGDPIKPGYLFYDETDLFWMSRIISAEARGEPMLGRIAVGNVVMNRLNSPVYPNTVRGVIFDRRHGIQFTPAHSGTINRTPGERCIIAAKLALEGANVVGDSLFFAGANTNSWASRNRTYVTTIGNHSFYA